jgi:ppGpp synthetase/RelA/SpoT-type nucleotidyltranferase
MAFTTRNYSKGRIDRAGNELITLPEDHPTREETLNVINNWRSCHSYPLQIIKMTLLNRAKQVNRAALIAQRLKRTPSIAIKLKDNPHMKLSQMQDIGGCRAVMPSVKELNKLYAVYEKSKSKNPHDRPVWIDTDDYVKKPKADGYRSIHLIYKYQSESVSKQSFNGQRIEIQMRSRAQHAWATAVEISQTFTGQALKSKVKSASDAWLRFFVLMGGAMALREKCPEVPGVPGNRKELVEELRHLANQEKILELLSGWGQAMQRVEAAASGQEQFLLVLDPTKKRLQVTPYTQNRLLEAQEEYLLAEKRAESDPQIQVVLVSVNSLDDLRKAYPNYYVDTEAFIMAVRLEIQGKIAGPTFVPTPDQRP